MCLCAADTQAKQEETGDSHWGLRMHTLASACALNDDQVCLNTANFTTGQTHVSDYIGQDNVGGKATCHFGVVYVLMRLHCVHV